MTDSLTVGILAYLTVSWAVQAVLCRMYVRAIGKEMPARDQGSRFGEGEEPRITVCMPLRGADPFLADAIRSVLDNEYANLRLHVVVDDREDPAWQIVEETVGATETDKVRVETLREKPPQRSLICSSLIQAFDAVETESDLICFCAADMIVPRHWYADMAQAMRDPEVGSLLGNRWYYSAEGRWGSLVRYCWNAGAVVLMWLFKIPWSGALALRPKDVHDTGLRELWSHGMVEDVPVYEAMHRAGRRMKFVPSLTIVNREEIQVDGAFRFLKRQMMWARLYHPRWPLVVGHALLGFVTLAGPLMVALWSALRGDWTSAAWLTGGVAFYLAGMALLLWIMESSMRPLLRDGEKEFPRWTVGRALRLIPAIALTQVCYLIAVVACCLAREVHWRGIRYRILGRGKIRMESYHPFGIESQPPDEKTSI